MDKIVNINDYINLPISHPLKQVFTKGRISVYRYKIIPLYNSLVLCEYRRDAELLKDIEEFSNRVRKILLSYR